MLKLPFLDFSVLFIIIYFMAIEGFSYTVSLLIWQNQKSVLIIIIKLTFTCIKITFLCVTFCSSLSASSPPSFPTPCFSVPSCSRPPSTWRDAPLTHQWGFLLGAQCSWVCCTSSSGNLFAAPLCGFLCSGSGAFFFLSWHMFKWKMYSKVCREKVQEK